VFKGYCIRKGCFVFVSGRHFGKECHNGEMLLGKRWCFHTKYVARLSRRGSTCFRGDKNRRLYLKGLQPVQNLRSMACMEEYACPTLARTVSYIPYLLQKSREQ
jgi:hypothetical protein